MSNLSEVLRNLDGAENEIREANRRVREARVNKDNLEQETIEKFKGDQELRRYLKIDTAKLRRRLYSKPGRRYSEDI